MRFFYLVVLFLVVFGAVKGNGFVDEFEHWMKKHGRTYENEQEKEFRFTIWKRALDRVHHHNNKKGVTWTKSLNKFSDWTWEEFQEGRLSDEQHCSATKGNFQQPKGGIVPETQDWREKGAVSVVKDQGNCGSCWTFSTTGCLESAHYLKTGEMPLLSEQQLVDCAQDFNNNGCSGGLPSQAFEYIAYNGGIESEDDYPYMAVDQECNYDSSKVAATVIGAVNITAYDEDQLQTAVGLMNPVSIAFQVYGDFKEYSGGVYTSQDCASDPDSVNHAVLAVGYNHDEESGLDYWIVKNSWGSDWGLDGYFYIEKGSNMCGLSDCASFPLV